MTNRWQTWIGIGAVALGLGVAPGRGPDLFAQEPAFGEPAIEFLWYASPGIGLMHFEGNQNFKPGLMTSLYFGRDLTESWSWEAGLVLAPLLDNRFAGEEDGGDWDDTYALGVATDAIYHFTRWDRWDPYLAAGLGFTRYGERPRDGGQTDWTLRGGGGVMYHVNDEWAVRADVRTMLAGFGDSPSANTHVTAGVVWTWAARVPPEIVALPTPPRIRDTDRDGISDDDEVHVYGTDPFNPDTDQDGLTDYEEIFIYGTDPLHPDTDRGGVSDGHEVLEDGTDPLDGADDLILFRLNIDFDTDDVTIRSRYFREIDIVALTMNRHPESTAVIEGHADRRQTSSPEYNQELSEQRANAVKDYLVDPGGVAAHRLETVGFGFSRPIAPNDPETGNRLNRRVDVYLRDVDKGKEAEYQERALEEALLPPEDLLPEAPPLPMEEAPIEEEK